MNVKFGKWTGQINAIVIAHYVIAVLHLGLVFFVDAYWNYSKELSLTYFMQIAGEADASEVNALAAEVFEQMSWMPVLLTGVIVVFSILFALNGAFLARGRAFARVNTIVLGVFLLLSFPIGTPAGVWFIYVMVQREVADAFKAAELERRAAY